MASIKDALYAAVGRRKMGALEYEVQQIGNKFRCQVLLTGNSNIKNNVCLIILLVFRCQLHGHGNVFQQKRCTNKCGTRSWPAFDP